MTLYSVKLLMARAVGIEPTLQGFGDPLTYQLSKRVLMAGRNGVEPSTFCVTGKRSNQLS